LAAARARGRVGGRPSVVTEEVIRAARDLLEVQEIPARLILPRLAYLEEVSSWLGTAPARSSFRSGMWL
jgi:hypothetical protein